VEWELMGEIFRAEERKNVVKKSASLSSRLRKSASSPSKIPLKELVYRLKECGFNISLQHEDTTVTAHKCGFRPVIFTTYLYSREKSYWEKVYRDVRRFYGQDFADILFDENTRDFYDLYQLLDPHTLRLKEALTKTYSLVRFSRNSYLLLAKRNGKNVYGRRIVVAFTPYKITPDDLMNRLKKLGFEIEGSGGGGVYADFKATRPNTLPMTVAVKNWDAKNGYRVTFRNIRKTHGDDLAEVLFSRNFNLNELKEEGFNTETLSFNRAQEEVPAQEEVIEVTPEQVTLQQALDNMSKDFYSMLLDGRWYSIKEIEPELHMLVINTPDGNDRIIEVPEGATIPIKRSLDLPVGLRPVTL